MAAFLRFTPPILIRVERSPAAIVFRHPRRMGYSANAGAALFAKREQIILQPARPGWEGGGLRDVEGGASAIASAGAFAVRHVVEHRKEAARRVVEPASQQDDDIFIEDY